MAGEWAPWAAHDRFGVCGEGAVVAPGAVVLVPESAWLARAVNISPLPVDSTA